MAQTIKLKRSAVAGRVPDLTDLALGEIAINTADGKLYIKKDVAGTETIVQIGSLDNVESINFSEVSDEGVLSWDSANSTLSLSMGNGVNQQIGEEVYYPKRTKNMTGASIPNGTPVMLVGGAGEDSYIGPAIADGTVPHDYYAGITTEEIADGEYGRVLFFGSVNDVDTSAYTRGQILYVSTTTPGGFTTTKPESPNHAITAALVTKVSSTEGRLFVRLQHNPEAAEIGYNNETSGLTSTNVKGAIDELQNSKADANALASNINLFPTTASSDITGYNKLVTAKTDPSYDTTAVDIATGPIGTTETNIGQLVSEANLIDGDLAGVTVTVVGNIDKTAGNVFQGAHFYFKVFHRDADGTETELTESNHTNAIYNTDGYQEFSASGYISNTTVFTSTCRIVYKFFATATSGSPEYNLQFGGESPIRCLLPVPVSVIPSRSAEETPVDAGSFSGVLTGQDTNVQSALDRLDDHNHDAAYASSAGYNKTEWDTAYGWGDHGAAGYAAAVDGSFTNGTFTGEVNMNNLVLTGYLRGPETFTIDPAAHGDNTGTLIIAGNLQVDGVTTTINSTEVTFDDTNIVLASDATTDTEANGAGITFGGQTDSVTLTYSSTGDKLVVDNATNVELNSKLTVNNPIRITGINKLEFGDDPYNADFQLYHNGNHAYIRHTSTYGNMFIDAANNLTVRNHNGDKYITAIEDDKVTLYYDNAAKLATTSTGVDVTGNIAVSGTVDGRDVATDGAKLDTIDANANNYVHPVHPGDDIDLDTGALTGATVISDLDFNVTTDAQGHVTDANATFSTRELTINDIGAAPSSHVHNTWDLPGFDSTKNIDTEALDRFYGTSRITETDDGIWPASYSFVANLGGNRSRGLQLASRFSSTNALYYRSGTDNPGAENGANSWKNWRRVYDSDYHPEADTVGGFTPSQFIRSDADDNVTGHTEWQDNYSVRFGNDADFRIYHNGEDTYFKSYKHSHGDIYFQGEDLEGTNHALLYLRTDSSSPYVQLFGNGAEKLRVHADGVTAYDDVFIPGNIFHSGDTDTYFGFHADNGWQVTTGGTQRLKVTNTTITTSNNVLIDGADAENALEIKGTSPTIALNDTNADSFYIHVNSNNFYVLADRDGSGAYNAWDGAHVLQLEADTNTGYLFGQQILTSSDIGQGNNIDADMLDGFHATTLMSARDAHEWSSISAASTQARRYTIMRVYGCPHHWEDTPANVEFKLVEENYDSSYATYHLRQDYNGGDQSTALIIDLKDASGDGTNRYKLASSSPTAAGWNHSGQPVYYWDIYVDVAYYKNVKVYAKALGHTFTTTIPTSGAGISVIYESPTSEDIADFVDNKTAAKFMGHTIWTAGNDGSGSGLDADVVRGSAPSTSATGNTLVMRNSSGDFDARIIQITNELRVPSNTAPSDPSITCTSDGDTGINFNGANQIDLVTGGANRVTIDGGSSRFQNVIQANNVDVDKKIRFVRTGGNSISIEHDTSSLYFYNETTANAPFKLHHNGNVTVNESGISSNFRVETNNLTYAFFVDGSENEIGINENNPNAMLGIQQYSGKIALRLRSATANEDVVMRFQGYDGSSTRYADIAFDADSGNERLLFKAPYNTSSPQLILSDSQGAIFNEGGSHIRDFRVESDTRPYMFFVDASANAIGIGGAPSKHFHVTKTAVPTKYLDSYSVAVIEDTEARLQLVSSNAGTNAAAVTLSNESHHWSMHHRGTSSGNYLAFGYANTTSTSDTVASCMGNIPLALTTSGNVGVKTTTPTEALDVNGNIKHNGLTMTSGSDIDQLYTLNASLTVGTSWVDVGISGADLASGTYIIQVYVNNYDVGGGQYNEFYSGVMSWISANTNDTSWDEIPLHSAGHADNDRAIYLRTVRTSSGSGGLKLQIASDGTTSGADTYTFKLRRMI